jgi:type I restriction enzyme S subunit
MELIPTGQLKFSNFILKRSAEVSSGTYFEEGDLLVSKITPCFENGKQGIAQAIPNGFGIATTEVIPLKPRDGLTHLPFVAYYLLHDDVRSQLAAAMEGATGRQRLPKDLLAQWPVPIPPLDEQRAIAHLLETIQRVAQVEGAMADNLAALKSATMAKLFREGLRGEPLKQTEIGEIPESWEVVRLGDIARVGNGSTPKRTNESYWESGRIPWITSTKIHEVIISQADEFVTETAFRECHLPLVPRKSLVIAITGQGKTLGNVALLELDTCINQHLAYIQLQAPSAVPEFYLFYLQSLYAYFRQISSSGGSTKGALTCGLIANLKVPFPHREEQQEVADVLMLLTRRHKAATKRFEALKSLFGAVLPQFMTGAIRVKDLNLAEVSHA